MVLNNNWMKRLNIFCFAPLALLSLASCKPGTTADTAEVKPVIITEAVKYDTDDPAIWVNKADPAKSLVIGTDKDADGALYVYDLQGKIIADKVVRGLKRPNNVDLAYGLMLNGKPTDIAITTERITTSCGSIRYRI
jgi:3-phytase